jgi:polyhydroxybutyrate depolymerase
MITSACNDRCMIPNRPAHRAEACHRRRPHVRGGRCALAAAAALVVASGVLAGGASGAAASPGPSTIGPVVAAGAAMKPAVTPRGARIFGTVLVAGSTVRSYQLYVPRSLPGRTPVPLLVALHGGLGSGSQFEQNSGFDGLAESNHFLVVYPNGTPIRRIVPNRLVWNGGGCCSVAAQDQDNVNDVGFISALIAKLEGRYHIDKHRVFATGHSNGAILAERLACQLSGQIVAIGVQAGDLSVNGCSMPHPVAALEIHGTQDQNIPINGGHGSRSLTETNFPPPVNGLKTIAAQDGCPSTPTNSSDPSNAAVHFTVWQPCHGGTVVEWATVAGANHAWMGHPASATTQRLVGSPYLGFDSSAAIWSFLAAHPRH